MGYSAEIFLEDASQRESFDRAAQAIGASFSVEHYGDGDKPTEWELRTLWYGFSCYRDLFEGLCCMGEAVHGLEGGFRLYALDSSIFVALGHAGVALSEGTIAEVLDIAEALGNVNEGLAERYWSDWKDGASQRFVAHVELPFPHSLKVSIPDLEMERDVYLPLWMPRFGEAREAVARKLDAEMSLRRAQEALDNALATGEAAECAQHAYDEALASLNRAKEHADRTDGTTPPTTDRLKWGDVTARLGSSDETVRIQIEGSNPLAHYLRMYELAKIITGPLERAGYPELVSLVYDFVDERPWSARRDLRRFGEIGRAAKEAGTAKLLVSSGW